MGRVAIRAARHLSEGDLVAYADGDAVGDRWERVGAHLATCPACRGRLEEFRRAGALLRERYSLMDDPQARADISVRTSGAPTTPHGSALDERSGPIARVVRRFAALLRRTVTLFR